MSFVKGPFKHDIFVSYSHGDFDGRGVSGLKQWSQAFVSELESELRNFPDLGRDLRIFIDHDQRSDQGVDPMEDLTEQLQEDIRGTALLSILMSPHYLGSKWCTDEREWWFGAQDEIGLPPNDRVAISRIWHFDDDTWPEELTGKLGFRFYDEATASEDLPQPWEWPEPDENSKGPFRQEMLRLAGRLRRRLINVKGRIEEQRRREAEADRLKAPGGQVIYLHGREEHIQIWQQASKDLQDQGFQVFPTKPDPVERNSRRRKRVQELRIETLSGCDALLLLGTDDGQELDADLVVVGRGDRHEARDLSDKLLPCAVLDTVGPRTNNPHQQKAYGLGIDWINAAVSPWNPNVPTWLQEAV